MSYCDAITLCQTCSYVSREWFVLSKCNNLWENLCRKQYGVSPTYEIKPKPKYIKEFFILSYNQFIRIATMSHHSHHPNIPLITSTNIAG